MNLPLRVLSRCLNLVLYSSQLGSALRRKKSSEQICSLFPTLPPFFLYLRFICCVLFLALCNFTKLVCVGKGAGVCVWEGEGKRGVGGILRGGYRYNGIWWAWLTGQLTRRHLFWRFIYKKYAERINYPLPQLIGFISAVFWHFPVDLDSLGEGKGTL